MRSVIVLLLAAVALRGQDAALARLKHELAIAREQSERDEKDGAARIAAVHAALRDWLETQLPKDVYSLAGGFSRLQASLPKALADAGFPAPGPADAGSFETFFRQIGLALTLMPELPAVLFVTASVNVGCGNDQAVYAYYFDGNGRTRIIEDHPKSDWGYDGAEFVLSEPDSQGRRLFLVHRSNVQCGSSWKSMTYAVYRMSSAQPPEPLFSSEHGFWMGNADDGRLFVLKPDELMIEFLDGSVDVGVHNRTYLLRYSFADGVKRIEPFAFQPQDFAEEWLTRPWSEMQSRSAPETQKWHTKLHASFGGSHNNVVLCAVKPDRWSLGLEQDYIGDRKLEIPISVHFLVHDLGNYRFEMEAVSDSEFEGCPGEGAPSDKHPWLSVAELKALP